MQEVHALHKAGCMQRRGMPWVDLQFRHSHDPTRRRRRHWSTSSAAAVTFLVAQTELRSHSLTHNVDMFSVGVERAQPAHVLARLLDSAEVR